MKHLLTPLAVLILGLTVITAAHAEFTHTNPADLSVTHGKIGPILVDTTGANGSIDVTFTEGRIQQYLDGDVQKCRWVAMGSNHLTFKDDPQATPPVYNFSAMLQWVATPGTIGEGFNKRTELKLCEAIGNKTCEYVDVAELCK